MSNPAKISLRNVHKAFGPKKVLQGVDLDVAPGESVAIIGGSGTGKSVTLKCVLGLLFVCSAAVDEEKSRRRIAA